MAFVLVSAVWAGLPLLAAIPLMLYFHRAGMPLSFTGAYFEAMSGLTTTGATVLTNLDALPPSINLWRATLIWIGGMGILVLAVAILPLLGVGGHQVVRAETPGPMKDERLTPRIASTARRCTRCISSFPFSVSCPTGPWACPGSRPGATWPPPWAWAAFHLGRRFRPLRFGAGGNRGHGVHADCRHQLRHPLQRLPPAQRAGLPALPRGHSLPGGRAGRGAGDLGVPVRQGVYAEPLQALRYGMFNTISMATTTGYANTDFAQWPLFAPLTMLLLSGFATSAGSTGGGIKMIRAILLIKQARNELVTMLHPHAVSPVRINGRAVEARTMASVLAFMLFYGLSIAVFTSLLLLSGLIPSRPLGRVRQRQQHRPRAGPGRPHGQLCRVVRLPDLGLHLRHADRAAGTADRAGAFHADFLAEIGPGRPRAGRFGPKLIGNYPIRVIPSPLESPVRTGPIG